MVYTLKWSRGYAGNGEDVLKLLERDFRKKEYPNNEDIKCTKERCIYKEQIEFGPQFIKLNGKNIPLKDGGYINLKKGVYYHNRETKRLWN